jgi:uncharacterized protein (DUF362 family)
MKETENLSSEKISIVSITRNKDICDYPNNPPFNPPKIYPEYPFEPTINKGNTIYLLVRNALLQMELDKQNIGTKEWNPFREIVTPGTTILIKPNFVSHYHEKGLSVNSVIVHGSVIRPIVDYVYIALRGKGKIIIADTPLENADFSKICILSGLSETIEYLKKQSDIQIELLDLRASRTIFDSGGKITKEPLSGDPMGYQLVDIGQDSALAELDGENTNYYTLGDHSVNHYNPYEIKRGVPNLYHNKDIHQYSIGRTVLSADTVISVAKLKVHKKAGVTLNLKNMIGIIHGKEFIPHHRPGSPPNGDSFPLPPPKKYIIKRSLTQRVLRILSKNEQVYNSIKYIVRDLMKIPHSLEEREHIEWGDWYGNDTVWRTILDVNKILFYADGSGVMREKRQRKYFCFIDGVIGMEGDGPMGGDAVPVGVIFAGKDPVAVDTVAAKMMGFDVNKLKTIKKAGKLEKYAIGRCDKKKIKVLLEDEKLWDVMHFRPPVGWVGYVEI